MEVETQEIFSSLIFICLVVVMCVVIIRCISAIVSANSSSLLGSDEYIEANIIPKDEEEINKKDNHVNNNNKV